MEGPLLQLGSLFVEFESNSPALLARIGELYEASVVTGSAPPDRLVVSVVEVSPLENTECRYRTLIDGEEVLDSVSWAEHERGLTRLLNRRLLDFEPQFLHLHAGAVSLDGLAVLLVAPSGSGKSTLTAQLVVDGWRYLTDEQVAIIPATGHVLPYPRPLTLRRPSWGFFQDQIGSMDVSGDGQDQLEVPASRFGLVHRGGSLAVGLIVRPSLAADGETAQDAMTAAEAIETLVGDSLDLGRSGLAGMEALVVIACDAPAITLRMGTPKEAAAAVRECFSAFVVSGDGAPRLGLTAAHAGPTPARVTAARPGEISATPGVHSWQFSDGSAFLFDLRAGRLARLDEVGLGLWQALTGNADVAPLDAGAGSRVARGQSFDPARYIEALVDAGFAQIA